MLFAKYWHIKEGGNFNYIPFNKVKNLSLQFYYRINTVKHVT